MWIWPFQRSPAALDGERLLAAVVKASRRPAYFGPDRVPDTLEGRLELMNLHASLAVIRLGREPAFEPLAQAFIDQFFRHLDAGLREAAVGDLAVPKRMRRIAGDFYGRLRAYAAALEAGDSEAFAGALARNLAVPEAYAATLAAYALDLVAHQAAGGGAALLEDAGWHAPPR